MYNNTYERPRTQIEKCEHLARMKFENPIEKAQRERDERVYRFSSIDEAIGVTACSSGIGSMNNYYTWGDSGVSRVSQTLDSDSGGYMASSQFNSSGKEYCYLVLGYDADWIKQKTAPSLSARG